MPVKCCETLRFLDFKCPSMLAVNLVYIEFTVQNKVLLSYICSVLHFNNSNNTGLVS